MPKTTDNALAPNHRPVVLISRCIGFEHCRWDGEIITSHYVEKLKKHVDFITRCPESDIGFGVPRKPVRLVNVNGEIRLLQRETGYDATDSMNAYAARSLSSAILKERSPSCGLTKVKIYNGLEHDAYTIPKGGSGFFAGKVLQLEPVLPCSSEGRLCNFALREHFYTQIYTLARFRPILVAPTISALIEFQARHKLILMCYHQTHMRRMGGLVSHHEKRDVAGVAKLYHALLCAALSKPPRMTLLVNVLIHALGYFSEKVSAAEKRFFLDLLEQYRAKKIPLSVCTSIIKSWIARFHEKYLADQYFFAPYPETLIEPADSGK
jgi:uncharacterized protein YbgA (DUF1722 family)/uncharacterized protein YbbK (DUF523 family)